jgi:hypothetical protein
MGHRTSLSVFKDIYTKVINNKDETT